MKLSITKLRKHLNLIGKLNCIGGRKEVLACAAARVEPTFLYLYAFLVLCTASLPKPHAQNFSANIRKYNCCCKYLAGHHTSRACLLQDIPVGTRCTFKLYFVQYLSVLFFKYIMLKLLNSNRTWSYYIL